MNEHAPRAALRADLVAGFLVFLIALPLCLGISMASGFPPVAGLITAIVGGLVSTFLGSAPLTIKGPAVGLIVIALGASVELGYRRALAVIVLSGVLQVGFAALRAGKLGDCFPGAVVHGMLAAIGVIIVSKQGHVLLGVVPQAKTPLGLLAELPRSALAMQPEVALIGGVSLAVLFGLPRLPWGWARRLSTPMVVLLIAVPLGLWFDLEHEHTYTFAHHVYRIGPSYLVDLPKNLLNAVTFPDCSGLFSVASAKYTVMFALVGCIESLLSAKAVDALDPRKQSSDLDRDLLATGVGNVVAGLLGGLPMISEIVRSSANISSGATGRRANFFHGLFLLLFVALVPHLLHRIPLAALAAMLIYTGFRLASPREFIHTYQIGPEQLVIFLTTLLVTLATDLLLGVGVGLAVKALIHWKNGASARQLLAAAVQEAPPPEEETIRLVVSGAAVFTNLIGLHRRLDQVKPLARRVELDLSGTRLVDHTMLVRLQELCEAWSREGRQLLVLGLEGHEALSAHPLAVRINRASAGGVS
jgi:MFS superfamily sulfate permease-like transporter